MTAHCGALLECKKLLGTEGFVVNLGCSFNEILQVSAGQEITEVDKFAVVLILDYTAC